MCMQTVQVHNRSSQVVLPKDTLQRDRIIEEDFEQNCVIDCLGRGQFLVTRR